MDEQQLEVVPASLLAVLDLREEYRREMGCQIVHDSWHRRGFLEQFELRASGERVGYAAVGGAPGDPRDAVKEFHLRPPFRGDALRLFRRLVEVSGARRIEAQTNDAQLFLLLLDAAADLASETILFAQGAATTLAAAGARFRPLTPEERAAAFPHHHEPVGEYGIDLDDRIVATGGFALHYNPPYADLFMEVDGAFRRRGLGAFLIQELKRTCAERGLIPAARCHRDNVASRRTLERAGLFPCARIVAGRIEG